MLFAYEITAEHKAEFIALIRDGYKPDVAAEALGSSGTQFRRHWSGKSPEHYDPEFAAEYHEALNSQEHHENLTKRIDDLVWKHAETNAQMALKLALVYHPDFEPLRHTNFNVNVRVDMIQRLLPYFPREMIEQALAAEEAEVGSGADLLMLPKPEAA